MANCSSGLLGVIVRNTLSKIPVVPLLALKIQRDLSEIAGWVGPTKKEMGVPGAPVKDWQIAQVGWLKEQATL